MIKRPIQYEPHPVSPERKQALKDQGFRIIDAKFAPPAKQQPALLKATRKQTSEGVQ